MKKCVNCGFNYDEQYMYCSNCGSSSSVVDGQGNEGIGNIVQQNISVEGVSNKTNGMCIAGFICSLFIAPIGFVISIIGLFNAKKKKESGKGFAIAGIIISFIITLLILVFVFLSIFIFAEVKDNIMLQTGCASLDSSGNFRSVDGSIVCENYYCTYYDGNSKISASCNLVDYDDVKEEGKENDSVSMQNTSWIAGDGSEIKFSYVTFSWYKIKDVYNDNYHSGTYKFFIGEDAVDYITEDLSKYGVTREELSNIFSRNEQYSVDNFVVFEFEFNNSYIDGQYKASENKNTAWFGFLLDNGNYLDVANMNTATYYKFTKRID